jgi:hypothetical protein
VLDPGHRPRMLTRFPVVANASVILGGRTGERKAVLVLALTMVLVGCGDPSRLDPGDTKTIARYCTHEASRADATAAADRLVKGARGHLDDQVSTGGDRPKTTVRAVLIDTALVSFCDPEISRRLVAAAKGKA